MPIKEKLKKSPIIVNAYETIFGRIHKVKYDISRKRKRMENGLIAKTHFCYGNKNKDKTFYVIYHNQEMAGLYSTIHYLLPYIDYAIKKNYIPIIDFKRAHRVAFQDEDKWGVENAWEYYYEQPIKKYTLEEVYQSRHVIVNEIFMNEDCAPLLYKLKETEWHRYFPASEQNLKYCNQIITSYIRLNKELEKKVTVEKERIFKSGHKILGVGIRAGLRAGAMRNEALYNNHPKQPTCEELIDIVEDKMEEWNCDYLFLACDDREYFNQFISHFKDRCYYFNRRLMHFFENGKPVSEASGRMIEYEGCTKRKKTEEYIIEMYLLAQCDCLYACKGGGTKFAYYLNGGRYEHVEVYDKGYYSRLKKS